MITKISVHSPLQKDIKIYILTVGSWSEDYFSAEEDTTLQKTPMNNSSKLYLWISSVVLSGSLNNCTITIKERQSALARETYKKC